MVISDIRAGHGLALIDPHGDLAEDVLNYVPKKRIEDVIYFNPADTEHPVPFNPLENVHPDYHHLVTSGLISVFKKVWNELEPFVKYVKPIETKEVKKTRKKTKSAKSIDKK